MRTIISIDDSGRKTCARLPKPCLVIPFRCSPPPGLDCYATFAVSHSWITAAMSALFASIIIM